MDNMKLPLRRRLLILAFPAAERRCFLVCKKAYCLRHFNDCFTILIARVTTVKIEETR